MNMLEKKRRKHRIPPQTLEALRILTEAGMSVRDIAIALRVNKNTVHKQQHRYGWVTASGGELAPPDSSEPPRIAEAAARPVAESAQAEPEAALLDSLEALWGL